MCEVILIWEDGRWKMDGEKSCFDRRAEAVWLISKTRMR
jgi:hypothetical protein